MHRDWALVVGFFLWGGGGGYRVIGIRALKVWNCRVIGHRVIGLWGLGPLVWNYRAMGLRVIGLGVIGL